jgi:hypothetical protein
MPLSAHERGLRVRIEGHANVSLRTKLSLMRANLHLLPVYLSLDPRETVSQDLLTAWSLDEGLAMFSVVRPPLHVYSNLDDDNGCVLAEETYTPPPVRQVTKGDHSSSPRSDTPASSEGSFASPSTPSSDLPPATPLLSPGERKISSCETAAFTNRLQLVEQNLVPTTSSGIGPMRQPRLHIASSSGPSTLVPLAPPETLLGYIQRLPGEKGHVQCRLCQKYMAPLALHRHLRVGKQHAGKWICQALNGERLTERVLASIIIISIATNFCRRNGVRNQVQLNPDELAAAMAFPHDVDGFSETRRFRLEDHPGMRLFGRPLRMMAHRCSTCGKAYARDDIRARHEKKCPPFRKNGMTRTG